MTFIIVGSASAQSRGYEKFIEVGFAPDIHYNEISYEATFTNGFRFNKHFFLGGGVGAFFFGSYSGDEMIETIYGDKFEPAVHVGIPVFGTIKANFTKTKVSPFFQLNLGYVFGGSEGIPTSGLYLSPRLGMDINLGDARKYAIIVRVGFDIQGSDGLIRQGVEYTRNRLNIGAGIRF